MASLNLATDPRTAVWRLIVAQLQADTGLAAAGVVLRFRDGSQEPLADLESYQSAAIIFVPVMGSSDWNDEGSIDTPLSIRVNAILTQDDDEDILNLQGALETALNTIGNLSFQTSLVAAGAVTGLIKPQTPLAPIKSAANVDGPYRLAGAFVIDVRRSLLS